MERERGCRFELFMHEYMERDGSAHNGSKISCKQEAYTYLHVTVPGRTVPKPCRVNAALLYNCRIRGRVQGRCKTVVDNIRDLVCCLTL